MNAAYRERREEYDREKEVEELAAMRRREDHDRILARILEVVGRGSSPRRPIRADLGRRVVG